MKKRKKKSRVAKLKISAVAILLILLGAVIYLVPGTFASAKIVIPAYLEKEDFQRPNDAELIDEIDKNDKNEIFEFINEKILKAYYEDVHLAYYSREGVEASKSQFSGKNDLHEIADLCARIMHLGKTPKIFIVANPSMKIHCDNFQKPIIIVSSGLLKNFRDKDELRFLIGREMGHVKCNHVKCMFYLDKILNVIDFDDDENESWTSGLLALPTALLLKWLREAEMTADNAGLLCCQDPETAEKALIRLKLGLSDDFLGAFDTEEYLRQSNNIKLESFADKYLLIKQAQSPHPYMNARIAQLRKYAESNRYKSILERKKPRER